MAAAPQTSQEDDEEEDNKTLDKVTLTLDLNGIPLRIKMGNPFYKGPLPPL